MSCCQTELTSKTNMGGASTRIVIIKPANYNFSPLIIEDLPKSQHMNEKKHQSIHALLFVIAHLRVHLIELVAPPPFCPQQRRLTTWHRASAWARGILNVRVSCFCGVIEGSLVSYIAASTLLLSSAQVNEASSHSRPAHYMHTSILNPGHGDLFQSLILDPDVSQ